MFDEMPDPREGDEVAWENVYLRAPDDDDTRDLELELRRLEGVQYMPSTEAEREEMGEIQERIREIVNILDSRGETP